MDTRTNVLPAITLQSPIYVMDLLDAPTHLKYLTMFWQSLT